MYMYMYVYMCVYMYMYIARQSGDYMYLFCTAKPVIFYMKSIPICLPPPLPLSLTFSLPPDRSTLLCC